MFAERGIEHVVEAEFVLRQAEPSDDDETVSQSSGTYPRVDLTLL